MTLTTLTRPPSDPVGAQPLLSIAEHSGVSMPRAKAHKKPKTPTEIAAEALANRMRDFAAVGLSPSQAALANNDDVQVVRENQEQVENAKRLDAFEALKPSMTGPKNKEFAGAYDAGRRLEKDVVTRLNENDRSGSLDRVDNGRESAISARLLGRMEAAERIEAVLALLSKRDGDLLLMLAEPPRGRFEHWRQIVAHVTGERNGNAQGAAVRAACMNLRDAYLSDAYQALLKRQREDGMAERPAA